VGPAVNMLSNDVNRYDWGLYFLPFIISVPFQLLLLTLIICLCVGPSFLAGLGSLSSLSPLKVRTTEFLRFVAILPLRFYEPPTARTFNMDYIVTGLIGAAYGKLRARIAQKSDRRLSLLTELINGMQLVKVSSWEERFRELLTEVRQ